MNKLDELLIKYGIYEHRERLDAESGVYTILLEGPSTPPFHKVYLINSKFIFLFNSVDDYKLYDKISKRGINSIRVNRNFFAELTVLHNEILHADGVDLDSIINNVLI